MVQDHLGPLYGAQGQKFHFLKFLEFLTPFFGEISKISISEISGF